MSRWTDATIPDTNRLSGKGAARRLRTLKRREAEHRTDATTPDRTRAYRQSLTPEEWQAYMLNQHARHVDCWDACPYEESM